MTRDGQPERLAEVLHAGLTLIAERGVAGASLRELARRLGMSQPSLYHYFATKDELVRRIVDHFGEQMVLTPPDVPTPSTLAEVPAFARACLLHLYTGDRHPTFVRVLFVISTERPEYRPLLRSLFIDRVHDALVQGGRLLAGVSGHDAEHAEHFMRWVVDALALPVIEERVLFGAHRVSPAVRRHLDFVVAHANLLAERLPRLQ